MIKMLKNIALVSIGAIALAGCSSNDDVDPDTLPVPLPEFTATFKPDVVWERSIGNGVDDYYSKLTPAVAYNKVFAADRDGEVKAFDKKTGDTIWSIDIRDDASDFMYIVGLKSIAPGRISGGISASYEKVYFGTENGEVIAVDEKTGDFVWRATVAGEVLSTPAVDEGKVFIQTGSGQIYALDSESGDVLWNAEGEVPPLTLRGTSSPVYEGGGVFIGGSEGKVSVYISESGQLAWQQAIAKPEGSTELERIVDVDTTPLIAGDQVYSLSYGGSLMSLDARNGRVIWKRDYAGFQDMTDYNGDIYVTDNQSAIYQIDRMSGIEGWNSNALRNRQVTAPVAQKGHVVVGDFEGYLHWFNAETGDLAAQYEVDSDGLYGQGVVDDDILYIQSRSGDLLAIAIP